MAIARIAAAVANSLLFFLRNSLSVLLSLVPLLPKKKDVVVYHVFKAQLLSACVNLAAEWVIESKPDRQLTVE